jgi:transposase-like protein
MLSIPYARHRSHPRLSGTYLRLTLSYRDVEELLAERGLDCSDETVRRWVPNARSM